MPGNNNMSEEDYLDSLLRAVSAGKEDFDIDDELDIDEDFDEQFEAEFEAELKAEFESKEGPVEIKEKRVKNTMAASNSIFTDEDDGLSEEDRLFSTEIKNSVLSSVMKYEDEKKVTPSDLTAEFFGEETHKDSASESTETVTIQEPVVEDIFVSEPEDVYKETTAFEPEALYKETTAFEPEALYNEMPEFEPEALYNEMPAFESEAIAEEKNEATEDVKEPVFDSTNEWIADFVTDTMDVPDETENENVSEISEEDDITNHLAAMLGGEEIPKQEEEKPQKPPKPSKDEIKAEKARIKANKRAAKEASRIARQAERAKRAEAKAKQKEENLVDSMADIFDSANDDLRKDFKENSGKRTVTAEEKTLDNSVDAALADLGLDALFNQIGQDIDEKPEEETTAPVRERRNFDDEDDEENEDNEKVKGKKKKEKKEKKPKKKKPPKPKKPKKKKTPKPKKNKMPDEVIPFSIAFLLLGLSLAALGVVAVTIGGNKIHYDTCMNKAVNYYVNKNYQAAYREIAGLEIKEKDEFFYEQVKVVMTVEANYDMFKSLMRLGKYDSALDSLLKGVDNFDLYQNEAREWEAFDDLEVSLRRVVAALEKYYGITESQAREINLISDRYEYSLKVAEIAANVQYNADEPFADETTTPQETTAGENASEEISSEERTTVSGE